MRQEDLNRLMGKYRFTEELKRDLEALLDRGPAVQMRPPPGHDIAAVAPGDSISGQATVLKPANPDAANQTLAPRLQGSDRHDLLEQLGSGGMGTVYRVKDRDLGRAMAMKIIHSQLLQQREVLSRFVEEAQITAQLEHPGIVPVHSMGILADGRVYFTMKEVKGRTFLALIKELHQARSYGKWERSPSGWTFQRLIDAFRRICEAVAYAHARAVIHRDLKPGNVMVGEFGEILVVDWGLAKVVGSPEARPERGVEAVTVVSEWRLDGGETMFGTIAGTPSYMAPEQVKGDVDAMAAPTDVYALGSMLYHILSGHPPFRDKNAMVVLHSVVEEPVPPFDEETVENTPRELRDLAMWCLQKAPGDRPAHAGVVADELQAFLEGAKRRDQALEMVKRADARLPELTRLRQEAEALRAEARAELARVGAHEAVARKAAAWEKEDRATALERDLLRRQVDYVQDLRAALSLEPDLEEAHRRLAAWYVERHREAEARGDVAAAVQNEALVATHDRRHRYTGYLDGEGLLSITTDPPEAEVVVHRFLPRQRRLVTEVTDLRGFSPVDRMALPQGSYLLEMRSPGRVKVLYPVHLGRQEDLRIRRPGENKLFPVPLPTLKALDADEIYVPPGLFWAGGDPEAPGALPRQQVWVEGFIIRRNPVTNGEYVKFLNDLVRQGRYPDAVRHAPRPRGASAGDTTRLFYGLVPGRGFTLTDGTNPELSNPDAPVCGVSWLDAMAFASWLAGQTGKSWRLPGEMEYEKAARGVDGRLYPWGNFADPAWACCFDSHAGEAHPASIRAFEGDVSPYGVMGMAGNMATWCIDRYHPEGPALVNGRYELPGLFDPSEGSRVGGEAAPARREGNERVIRGGAWSAGMQRLRAASRERGVPDSQSDAVGIRLVASLMG